jgi:ferritin-like metal-binding protein YciE
MKVTTLEDLLVEELRDLYNAEKQLLKALPRMAKAASSEQLRAAFEEHTEVTQAQIERLDQVFKTLKTKSSGKKCVAMEGLIEEGKEIISEKKNYDPDVLDAALITAAQKVEHYEIAGYGSVRTFANLLGLSKVAKLLQKTLDEEGATDKKLTALAEQINVAAEDGEEE